MGPPWISIETSPNPFVDGARHTVSLAFGNTSRPGVYALREQWPDTKMAASISFPLR